MPKMEVIDFFCPKAHQLSPKEQILVESYLYVHLCRELRNFFETEYKSSFQFGESDLEKEDFMFDTDFLNFVIQDILLTEEYSLAGIAIHTHIPLDVIRDLVSGINKAPSSFVWRKLVELHSTIRHELYRELINKIVQRAK